MVTFAHSLSSPCSVIAKSLQTVRRQNGSHFRQDEEYAILSCPAQNGPDGYFKRGDACVCYHFFGGPRTIQSRIKTFDLLTTRHCATAHLPHFHRIQCFPPIA